MAGGRISDRDGRRLPRSDISSFWERIYARHNDTDDESVRLEFGDGDERCGAAVDGAR